MKDYEQSSNASYQAVSRRIVLKFRDDVDLPFDHKEEKPAYEYSEPFESLIGSYEGLIVRRGLSSLSAAQIRRLQSIGEKRDPSYQAPDFLRFFALVVPPEIDPLEIQQQLSSDRWNEILEYSYIASGPTPSPCVPSNDNNLLPGQFYLHQPQMGTVGPGIFHMGGIYAHDTDNTTPYNGAWQENNSCGQTVTIIDIERGWETDHPDLDSTAGAFPLLWGTNKDEKPHGTCVLGILKALDNDEGCVGIAREADVKLASTWETDTIWDVESAIAEAVDHLSLLVDGAGEPIIGNIILLETQARRFVPDPANAENCLEQFLPIESEPLNWEVIRLATAIGIVVVEAAGNGSRDWNMPCSEINSATAPNTPRIGISLDNITTDIGQVFSPTSLGQNSGAILVAAARSNLSNDAVRTGSSNYGARVDCFAWGISVRTPTVAAAVASEPDFNPDANGYAQSFGGTSSAAAIVAGAAAVMQSLAEHHLGFRLDPVLLRQIMKNTGTSPLADPNQGIGNMPNLRAYFDTITSGIPEIFIRDNLSDVGNPHTGSLANSPDIIVRPDVGPNSVANPQAAFGANSGTAAIVPAGSTVISGIDHSIFVRTDNRGGVTAQDVRARVYYSRPSSLLTPDDWNFINETPMGTAVNMNTLTVLTSIAWSSADLPPVNPDPDLNHYCFIATIGNPDDPDPIPDPTILPNLTWDQFRQLIRNNNNITWRNFNVVPKPAGFNGLIHGLFWLRGAWDQPRPMSLEIQANLPPSFGLSLITEELELLKLLAATGAEIDSERITLNPNGTTRFESINLPQQFETPVILHIDVPQNHNQPGGYEVFARQLFEGEEVGRITWQLVLA